MPKPDQLEIISPNGEIDFYDLDVAKGITNIGRHPDNDIIIDAPDVAPFHAILDHRKKPYEIVILSDTGETRLAGKSLSPNATAALQNWDTLEVNHHLLILLEESGTGTVVTAPRPAGAKPAAAPPSGTTPTHTPSTAIVPVRQPQLPSRAQSWQLSMPQPDYVDDFIVAQLAQREVTLNVDQPTTFEITVINGSPIVASFEVAVEGLASEWVTITPEQINLNEGDRGTVYAQVLLPRHPSSLAGVYNVAFVVRSPNYPDRSTRLGAEVTISPYYAFKVGELSPKQQRVSWRRQTAQATIPITNQSNSPTTFRLTAEDDERACNFEFEVPDEGTRLAVQAQIPTQPDQMVTVPMFVTPTKRPLFGVRRRMHPYTATVAMLESDQAPRSLLGQLKSKPLIGPFLLALIVLSLAILTVLLFKPNVQTFLANGKADTMVTAGDEVAIAWKVSAFSTNVSIQPQDTRNPVVDTNKERSGQLRIQPVYPDTYTVRAESFLYPLLDPIFPRTFKPLIEATEDVTLNVKPIYPIILAFSVEGYREMLDEASYQIFQGDAVNLRWTVQNANELELAVNSEPQFLPTTEHTAQRNISPQINSGYKLVARNRYTGEGAPAPEEILSIFVVTPTPTPVPVPVPQRFTVRPLEITAGETVTIEWEVPNATKVNISNVDGDFPPLGTTTHKPPETTDYRLTAFYKEGDIEKSVVSSIVIRVVVKPAPTPTVPPVEPKIELFEATYSGDFIRGVSKDVTLVWSVTGDTDNIEIEGASMGTISNLDPNGRQPIVVSDDTYFILKVYYDGDIKASKMIQLTAMDPTPTPPPPTPTPMPPTITRFEAAAADDDAVIVAIPVDGDSSNTRAYEVKFGSNIMLSWIVENASNVTLDFIDQNGILINYGDQSPQGQLPVNVTASGQYRLKVEHQDPSQNPIYAYIQIKLMAMEKPPAPTNVRGPAPTNQTAPIDITWNYPVTSEGDIIGFAVYRGNSGDPPETFTQVSGLITETAAPHVWTDNDAPVCSKGYYVVAVYVDIADNQTKESDASNLWYTEPCPTPTP